MATRAELMSALSGVWMIEETAWQRLCAMAAEGVAPKAASRSSYRSPRSVAVIPVHGVIEPKMSLMSLLFGGTGLDAFSAEFRAAVEDKSVKGIVLDIDSPGGSVTGTPEAADMIYQARGSKPIVSVVNPMCCSGAYYLAASTDRIVGPESGRYGSVGVRYTHYDVSEMMAQMGVKETTIIAKDSPHKNELDPSQPLQDSDREEIQNLVDDAMSDFVASVSRGRGVSREEVVERFGQGRVVTGRQAKRAGMIDRFASLDETVSLMAAGRIRPRHGSESSAEWWGVRPAVDERRKALAEARRRRLAAM